MPINTILAVLIFAFPDVCFVPVLGVPVPMPFPNIALSTMDIPAQFQVIICGGLAENIVTIGSMSNGDNAGVEGGVVSHLVMGPFRGILGSFVVFVGGMPATHLASVFGQNGLLPNIVGLAITPAQATVLVMR
jgi:hypothetical protein